MTRSPRLVAVLAVAVLLLGGCGLPSSTDPKYVGPAPTARPVQERPEQPPTPGGAVDLDVLVNRYMATSVGGNVASVDQPDAVSETQARMKTFMTEQAQLQWQPGNQPYLTVVKTGFDVVQREGGGRLSVSVLFTPVYTLDRTGQLGAPQVDPSRVTFRAEQVGGRLLLSEVPNGMWLSTEGLRDWYEPQPIYFWEKDVESPKLVPDLRYMPSVLPASKRVSEVMLWLAEGPSPWLNPVVERLPSEIETKDNPSLEDRAVKVNLTSKARGKKPEDLRKVARQIRWSIAGHPPVTLTIENAKDDGYGSDGFDSDNAAVIQGELDQEKFVVLNNVVRPAEVPAGGPTALFTAGGEWNNRVVSAAINRARTKAALVRNINGKQTLFVSAADATATNPPKYVETSVSAVAGGALSRPAWIDRPMQRFLIADGRQLYAVTPPAQPGEQPQVEVVRGPNGDTEETRISAFAVSPDGRRIALIVGNTTRIAALQIENGRLKLGVSKQVANTLGANKSVGWYTETALVIGGQATLTPPNEGRYSLLATSVDGTGELLLPVNGPESMRNFDITQMSVRTNDPLKRPETYIMFESNGLGQVVFYENPGSIVLSPAGPAPSATATATDLFPRSPFYAD